MKKFVILAVLLLVVSSPQKNLAQTVGGAVGAASVSAFVAGLRGLVNDIDEKAENLIQLGNIAAAQQQMLLAGILTQTIDQIETAYADSLDKTIDGLSVLEQNAFTNLQTQFAAAEGLVSLSAEEAQETIYKAQGAANQLLDRLPIGDRYPVFYGATVGDLSPAKGEKPADIEILGFLLSDPHLDRKRPVVSVAGEVIDAHDVSVLEDRILVSVPLEIKERLGLDNEPCNPRRTFPIALQTFYAEQRGFWPIRWNRERTAEFSTSALAAPDRYDVLLEFVATRITQKWERRTFETEPQYRNVGCERGNNASARFEAPPGSRLLQCTAQWTGTSNLKRQSADCPVGGLVATGSGSIRGRDKEWTGNCPGGGHGYFNIKGSYEVPVNDAEPFSSDYEFTDNAPLDVNANLRIDETLRDATIKIAIHRHLCTELIDQIDISGVTPALRTEQSSRNGNFKALLQNGQVTIEE